MRSPQSGHSGGSDTPPPPPPPPYHHPRRTPTASPHDIRFQSTLSVHKLKRFNSLILLFRVATFVFSLSAFVFMLTNSRSQPHWFDFDAFRYVLAANGIVAVYSLVEMVASVWEVTTGATLFPEVYQVWFDFGHDQVFAYLLLSAGSAGTALVKSLRGTETCTTTSSFCVQSDISIALGFTAFIFLSFSSLMSGFRVACFLLNGSRFHLSN